MNKMSGAQRRKLFLLAGEKGLDNELLHDYVQHLTGKSSLQLLTVMDAIKVIDSLEGKKQNAENMITQKQRRFIEGLAKEMGWTDEHNNVDLTRLNGFISSKFKIENINWLPSKKASEVIEGLKAIKSRKQKDL